MKANFTLLMSVELIVNFDTLYLIVCYKNSLQDMS